MSNKELRFNLAAQELSRLNEENSLGLAIIVEGKKDITALRKLGFKGVIEQLNRGWDVDRFCTYLFETYGTRNDQGGPVIELLMDWDRTGGRLQKRLVENLQSLDVKFSQEARKVLSRALKPETKFVEALSSLGLEQYFSNEIV